MTAIASPADAPGGAAATSGPDIEILPGRLDGPLDFRALFGNGRAVEIEIGSGKGRFLLAQAAARPEVNFLGVEWSLKYLRLAKERALRQGLANVRLFHADARHVLAELVPEGSAGRIHVYCPDPWPKKRHHKRRLFTPLSVTHMTRALAPGGSLCVSTDVREYFDVILELLRGASGLVETADPLFPIGTADGRSSYEIKYLKTGRPIHRATFRRVAAG